MEEAATWDYLETLLDYAFDLIYVRNLGENRAEFVYVQSARVAETYPDVRRRLLQQMERSLLDQTIVKADTAKRPSGFIPSEFIFFLAHRTKWSDFEAMAERVSHSSNDVWHSNPLRRSSVELRNAMSSNWQDAEFYSSFADRSARES